MIKDEKRNINKNTFSSKKQKAADKAEIKERNRHKQLVKYQYLTKRIMHNSRQV